MARRRAEREASAETIAEVLADEADLDNNGAPPVTGAAFSPIGDRKQAGGLR